MNEKWVAIGGRQFYNPPLAVRREWMIVFIICLPNESTAWAWWTVQIRRRWSVGTASVTTRCGRASTSWQRVWQLFRSSHNAASAFSSASPRLTGWPHRPTTWFSNSHKRTNAVRLHLAAKSNAMTILACNATVISAAKTSTMSVTYTFHHGLECIMRV